mmetsp:Transcript_3741/g.6399  ORF Transcript_3741/g.6399 Transcript_3741/m.6399 type:complete len:140 (+) Transcript_3741:29-448(+)
MCRTADPGETTRLKMPMSHTGMPVIPSKMSGTNNNTNEWLLLHSNCDNPPNDLRNLCTDPNRHQRREDNRILQGKTQRPQYLDSLLLNQDNLHRQDSLLLVKALQGNTVDKHREERAQKRSVLRGRTHDEEGSLSRGAC